MKKIKHYIAILSLLFVIAAPVAVSASPVTQLAAKCNVHVLTFPAWYNNLNCQTVEVNGKDTTQPQITSLNDIWKIALNIVEALIGAAAYAAVGYIIWAGFKYIKSRGDPGKITEARMAITQAVIGLGVALASTAIVVFIGSLF